MARQCLVAVETTPLRRTARERPQIALVATNLDVGRAVQRNLECAFAAAAAAARNVRANILRLAVPIFIWAPSARAPSVIAGVVAAVPGYVSCESVAPASRVLYPDHCDSIICARILGQALLAMSVYPGKMEVAGLAGHYLVAVKATPLCLAT